MTVSRALLTISSINYLGQVTTLMHSAQRHEPDALRYVVLVDRQQAVPGWDDSLATIIWVEDLLGTEASRASFIFNVLEFNTNVKPRALLRLCAAHEMVTYLDPDTELFAPLTPVWQALATAEITLTPHMLRPPMDDCKPSETDLMRHGAFNLGFIAVRASATAHTFLQWWSANCLAHGFSSPQDGLYVDQKFIDLIPAYFPGVHVLRHPGLNVAYWNLHDRSVTEDRGSWRVNGEPLVFMHFSGFIFKPSGTQINKISKYPNRIDLKAHPELRPLFEGYRDRLTRNGFATFVQIPYSFSSFSDGRPINQLSRRVVAANIPALTDVGDYFCADGPVHAYCRRSKLLGGTSRASLSTGANASNERNLTKGRKVFRFLFQLFGPDRYLQLLRFCEEMGSTVRQGFIGKRF